jgi:hypothetical protein
MNITIPIADYGPPHPEGNHRGRIVGVDVKELQTQHGDWKAVEIVIENEVTRDGDGSPFRVRKYFTLSSHEKSNLLKFRELMKGTRLTREECASFPDAEVIGRRVGFVVVHKQRSDGSSFPSVESVWPLDEQFNTSGESNEHAAA